jgi:hypothetical protein
MPLHATCQYTGRDWGFNWFVSGTRFGLIQVKIGLSHILTRYEIAPCKDTPVPLLFDAAADKG